MEKAVLFYTQLRQILVIKFKANNKFDRYNSVIHTIKYDEFSFKRPDIFQAAILNKKKIEEALIPLFSKTKKRKILWDFRGEARFLNE
ncbi:MAG: hypothetical protein ACRC2O_05135 [Chitinophagaceae bacterium]